MTVKTISTPYGSTQILDPDTRVTWNQPVWLDAKTLYYSQRSGTVVDVAPDNQFGHVVRRDNGGVEVIATVRLALAEVPA